MSVVAMGELLIDFVAIESGRAVGDVDGFLKKPGGAPANVAVAVAKLGRQSAFIGQVGDDPFGHYLANELATAQVDVSGLRFSTQARTMLAFVSLGADGERSFMFYRHPSADMLMRPADVDTRVIDAARVFHFGSITLIDEPAKHATLHAAKHARQHNTFISYDPNLRLALWPDARTARNGMLEGFQYAHLVKISEDELDFLTEGGTIADLWHDTTQMIVVTRGAKGATLYTRNGDYSHHGYKVTPVDTTGAGDAFVAGLLVSILDQQDAHNGETPYIEEILRFANATGAITTQAKGAIPALPTREQVTAFIQSQRHQ